MRTPIPHHAGKIALAAVLCAGAALAAPTTAEAQIHFETDYSNLHRHTLDNGLDVLIVEDHNLPIVTIEMAARNGAFTQEPDFSGLAHLYEHMFFKANAVYPNQEAYMARQQELGMSWNGTTSTERVNYFFTLPSELAEEGTEFMAAALLTPQFDQQELEREQEVVLGEYDRSEASPWWHLHDATDQLLWFQYPDRKDPLGDRDAIANSTVAQMKWMQETYYVPNNSLLIYAGDITEADALALAEKHFGAWERAEDPHATYPVPEHPPLTADVARVVTQPVNISAIQMSWQGPNTRESVQDTYAADIFSYILSQGTSELQRQLVDSGLALSAGVSYHTQRYGGPISFTVIAQPGREDEVIAAMQREIERFADPDYFTDQQLATAKTIVAVQDLTTQQSTLDLAHTLSFWWCSADVDYYTHYVENLEAVSREDIQRFVQQWITGKPRATVLLTNEDTAHGWDDARINQRIHATETQP